MWQHLTRHQRTFSAILGAGVVLAVGLRLLNPSSPLGTALAKTSYNSYYQWMGVAAPVAPPTNALVVYLDLESYLRYRVDPASAWPRTLHARLMDRLTKAGARSVVMDILFEQEGKDPEGDQTLQGALQRNRRTILAAELGAQSQNALSATPTRATRLTLPAPAFASAAAGCGVGNLRVDDDFVVRRHYPGDTSQEIGSLTYAAARVLGLAAAKPGAMDPARWLRYYGRPFALPHVSYAQALDAESTPDDLFRDRIVLVGARPMAGLFGERRDEFRSPYHSWPEPELFMPGVEVHATEMLNLLRGDWLTRPSPRIETGLILVIALVSSGLFWLRPSWSILAASGAAASVFLGARVAFTTGNTWFPWLVPVLGQLPLALGGAVTYQTLEWYRLRRRLEAAKRKQEEQIREQAALIEKAHDAVLVQGLSGKVLFANASAMALYGWHPEALPDVCLQPAGPDETSPWPEIQAALDRTGDWQGSLNQVDGAGRHLVVESRWTLLRDPQGKPKSYLIINRDVTEQRRLESETLRLQRMEGIGALAGGMAHDLNNALAPILMGTQLLHKRTTDSESRRVLSLVESCTRRGAEMVRQVLLFARGRSGDFQRLDVRVLLKEMEKLIRDTFPRNIAVSAYVAEDLWSIRGDATQIHQVLLNLCVNARDAMPGGGALSLVADNADLVAETLPDVPGAVPGAYVCVLVTDTGTGIPAEILSRIFEPFFSTKAEGKGTGLGLSSAVRIVKAHRGFLNVKSQPGEGTTFEIYLPQDQKGIHTESTPSLGEIPRGCGEWILVADDDQAVREMLQQGLTDHGYRVVLAANGAEAISRFKERPQEFAAVVSDTDMPLMDGPATLAAARELNPTLACFLMSGEASGTSARDGTQIRILQKPFELPELLRSLALALGSGNDSPSSNLTSVSPISRLRPDS